MIMCKFFGLWFIVCLECSWNRFWESLVRGIVLWGCMIIWFCFDLLVWCGCGVGLSILRLVLNYLCSCCVVVVIVFGLLLIILYGIVGGKCVFWWLVSLCVVYLIGLFWIMVCKVVFFEGLMIIVWFLFCIDWIKVRIVIYWLMVCFIVVRLGFDKEDIVFRMIV